MWGTESREIHIGGCHGMCACSCVTVWKKCLGAHLPAHGQWKILVSIIAETIGSIFIIIILPEYFIMLSLILNDIVTLPSFFLVIFINKTMCYGKMKKGIFSQDSKSELSNSPLQASLLPPILTFLISLIMLGSAASHKLNNYRTSIVTCLNL